MSGRSKPSSRNEPRSGTARDPKCRANIDQASAHHQTPHPFASRRHICPAARPTRRIHSKPDTPGETRERPPSVWRLKAVPWNIACVRLRRFGRLSLWRSADPPGVRLPMVSTRRNQHGRSQRRAAILCLGQEDAARIQGVQDMAQKNGMPLTGGPSGSAPVRVVTLMCCLLLTAIAAGAGCSYEQSVAAGDRRIVTTAFKVCASTSCVVHSSAWYDPPVDYLMSSANQERPLAVAAQDRAARECGGDVSPSGKPSVRDGGPSKLLTVENSYFCN